MKFYSYIWNLFNFYVVLFRFPVLSSFYLTKYECLIILYSLVWGDIADCYMEEVKLGGLMSLNNSFVKQGAFS